MIRMLEHMMGEENFAQGVTSYLKEFQFKNAETNDLWAHLQKFAGRDMIPNSIEKSF